MREYYCKIVKNYDQIATPLTTLLEKEAFSWTSKETKAFKHLKEAMFLAPVLATPNFAETFIAKCDALGNGIGAVLIQEGRPIAFESCSIKGNYFKKAIMRRKCWQYYMH